MEDTWLKGWQKQAMLRRILAKRPHEKIQCGGNGGG